MPNPAGRRRAISVLLAAATLLCGCSVTPTFPDRGAGPFHAKLEIGSQAEPGPEIPGPARPPGPGAPGRLPPGPPRGCTDPDPQVVATCLEPISALVVLPGSAPVGLAAERTTGRILQVRRQRPNQEIAALAVDPAGDGGLTGLALSPSYAEDELIYAYITTSVDNRVVRIAPGDIPKPVLVGIPRGPTGNAGALAVDSHGMLLVATGDAGNPAAAEDPRSLAGKVLRIDTFGHPAPGNPGGSPVLVSGLRAPGGLCIDPLTNELWITDREPDHDLLHRVRPGRPLGRAAWTWPGGTGAAGCVVMLGRIQVAFTSGAPMFALGIGPGGTFIGPPLQIPLEHYGHIAAAALSPDGQMMWLGTVNKTGGRPISSDERVFLLPDPVGPGGGQD
ncbi:MAG: PQQ-dependent sugar dehydrogenase [Pseudonocardiales bacterium]|nr:PQQ-dependent sugar dehydrogenase [Pseudonocardiales bacterium]MBV9032684.1 PQQ-dependent sugar dehydrogenase [Pseudonocardiales bacterium]MBW0011131.1 PQQ-dependent sugar dehydrogenase [Pseudonocardiales bacterium]